MGESNNDELMDLLEGYPVEDRVCARVLQQLAIEETPKTILSAPPTLVSSSWTEGPSNETTSQTVDHGQGTGHDRDNVTTSNRLRGSVERDALAYLNRTWGEDRHNLVSAVSILLDATSRGPDPLALDALGWAYGMGGGGGMGDWDGCHYLPGPLGQTLRVLQDQVAVHEDFRKYFRRRSFWMHLTPNEYGDGTDRPPARFCTVGGVPVRAVPYQRQGMVWGPPIAGVCVPSACTTDALRRLFVVDNDLHHNKNHTNEPPFGPYLLGLAPPQSRSHEYVRSLLKSFSVARRFHMGLVCEGETGLPDLDYEDYVSTGYYVTCCLIFFLLSCVVLGTVRGKGCNSRGLSSSPSSYQTTSSPEIQEDKGEPTPNREQNQTPTQTSSQSQALLPLLVPQGNHTNPTMTDYGSSFLTNNNNNNHKQVQVQLHKDKDKLVVNDNDEESENTEDTNNTEEQTLIKVSTCHSAEGKKLVYKGEVVDYFKTFTRRIRKALSYFDANESWKEITRIRTEHVDTTPLQFLPSQTTLPSSSASSSSSVSSSASVSYSISSSKHLNGLRVISELWIMMGHSMAIMSSIGYLNPAAVLPPTGMMSSALGMIFLSARYAVDTFFFIGGFLIMSSVLQKLDRTEVVPTLHSSSSSSSSSLSWITFLERWNILQPNHVVLGDFHKRAWTRRNGPSGPSAMDNNNNSSSSSSSSSSSHRTAPAGVLWMIPLIVHRIFRILPTYAFVLLLWWKVAVTLGEGPFWPRWATLVAQCDAHAWTNLLFVNNLVPWRQPHAEQSECMYHTWYLAVDFQMVVVLTPICVMSYLHGWRCFRRCNIHHHNNNNHIRGRVLTVFLEGAYLLVLILLTAVNTYRYEWSGALFDGRETGNFDRDFYTNAFYRSSPYVIGFVTAQLWHEKCRHWPNLGLTRPCATVLSVGSVVVMAWLTLVGLTSGQKRPCLEWESVHSNDCGTGWSRAHLAAYNSLLRPLWATALAVLSLLAFNGQFRAPLASPLLSWRGWEPAARLSFAMYLVHPLVINLYVFGGASKFRYSHVTFLFTYAGIVVVSALSALLIGILVQWPLSKLLKDVEHLLFGTAGTATVPSHPSPTTLTPAAEADARKQR